MGFEASGAGELTTRARAEFARRRPGVRVVPRRYDWGQEAAALREGLVGVASVWLPSDLTGLRSEPVHTEPRVVGMPSGHALAGRDGISVLDAADEPLMRTERAARMGGLVGGQPQPERIESPLGADQRQRRGDAGAGGGGFRHLLRTDEHVQVLRPARSQLGAADRCRAPADRARLGRRHGQRPGAGFARVVRDLAAAGYGGRTRTS
ncbi:LysR substrate-binding domain-containing protein [Streptomyces sp. NPDC018352]|uniref:LysR substrate-binding domain-containing protein n=1 Tax=Streptomyces sp. NPDC018352 TaxID=3157194 RepID=UPI00340BDDCC